jgi:hypothetical protein
MDRNMDRDQKPPEKSGRVDKEGHPKTHDNNPKLGRETPRKGLDTGFDTGAIQPGQTDGAHPLD